ncbi:TonB-dependent receptor [Rhodobacteraceae bacterium KMM 6894]|nr:TonB-dependent receptor [Rhodobacteraceae bacterium KMM 6894]
MKRNILNSTILCAAIVPLSLTCGVAQAQDADSPYDLGEIILSGGLTPVEAAAFGRSATVITGDALRTRGIVSVQNALRTVPGVAVSSAGGNFTQVRIRGGEASHTLILIDGVEAAGGDGEYSLSGLDTSNIERIEVLRGPQTVFYGANASSGVINIITRTGDIGTQYGTSAEVGSHGSTTLSGFASQRGEKGGLSLSFSDMHDAGYDFSGDGGERDATDRTTWIFKGDVQVLDTVKLGFNLRKSEEDFDFDSTNFAATDADSYIVDDATQVGTSDEMTMSFFAQQDMLDGRLQHRLTYELTDNDSTSNNGPVVNEQTEAYKYRLSFGIDGGTVDTANHLANLLLEHETDRSNTNALYARHTQSVALEYRGSFANGLDVQAGARFDDNSVFKDATTWSLGASYTFAGSGVRLRASAGTGVVNPSYFELYANAWGTVGNPNLRPEESRSFDIGVDVPFAQGRGEIGVTYFNEELEDEITFVAAPGGGNTYINQTGTSKRQGIEVQGQFAATDTIDLRLNYTYLDATEPNGAVEVRRPEHELGIGMTAQAFGGRGSVSVDLRHVTGNRDSQFFPPFGAAELPDYTTVDVATRYALTDAVDATFRITNLFDEAQSDVWGYAGRDRAFYVGLDANW